jgi:predicted NUDIX family NTP pyrophosphohydrolase
VSPKTSAGLLLYRPGPSDVEVLIGHMGGPFFSRKDGGAWSIPKGEYTPQENAFVAAQREFVEELGLQPPLAHVTALGTAVQSGGKVVTIWASAGDLDLSGAVYGTFEMEWPRGSGRLQTFPEIDRAVWTTVGDARLKLVGAQRVFLDRLAELLGSPPAPSGEPQRRTSETGR